MIFALLQAHSFRKLHHLAIDASPETLLIQRLKLFAKFALPPPHDRRKYSNSLTRRKRDNPLHNLLRTLP